MQDKGNPRVGVREDCEHIVGLLPLFTAQRVLRLAGR